MDNNALAQELTVKGGARVSSEIAARQLMGLYYELSGMPDMAADVRSEHWEQGSGFGPGSERELLQVMAALVEAVRKEEEALRQPAPASGEVGALVEAAYREGHQTGRCGASFDDEDQDWSKSKAAKPFPRLAPQPTQQPGDQVELADDRVEAAAKAHCDYFGGDGWWDTGLIADTKPRALEAMRAAIAAMPQFQAGVDKWMDACFGEPIKSDQLERDDRFIEECLELAQTNPAFTADRAHALVDYVFSRPVGEPMQETGGVMVTLAARSNVAGISMTEAADTELARIWTKVEQIRAKQAAKPTGSALPLPAPPAQGEG